MHTNKKYLPVKTAHSDTISKLQPHTMILIVLQLTLLIFIIDNLQTAALLMLLIMLFSGGFFYKLKNIKNIAFLVLIIILIQSFFSTDSSYIERLIKSLTIGCRLFSLFLLLPLLLETVSPYKIASGLTALGINYKAAFIITTALNMIPSIKEEGGAIIDAQKLRGMDIFEKKSPFTLFKKIKSYSCLITPLVLGAMRKAQISSAAMDSRAFGAYKTRTWLNKPKMVFRDYLALSLCTLVFIAFLFLNFYFLRK